MTSENTRFVFIYHKDQRKIEEDDLKSFFKALHYEFAKVMMNPLYKLNSFIQNPFFEREVDKLLSEISK